MTFDPILTTESLLAVVGVASAVYSGWRVGLVKTLRTTCESLTTEVQSLTRRLDEAEHRVQLATTRVQLYRNQVATLLELIREHKIVGASHAARIIAQQMAEEEADSPESVDPPPMRQRSRASRTA